MNECQKSYLIITNKGEGMSMWTTERLKVFFRIPDIRQIILVVMKILIIVLV